MKWITREKARVDRIACRCYRLDDPALKHLALIVRGADTDARQLTPESAGVYAPASWFQALARDDHENMRLQFPAYDALYRYCRDRIERRAS